ncbi:MAG TPA: type 1 glutamine amidotransferase [Thermoleophilaceae bacterium]|jgi:GMP synthase (glutamine-hydrolysing)|nr:type 1 glutamine amidotransferase [Thermoleophilaceae bacterium]
MYAESRRPRLREVAGVMSFGGQMSVTELDGYPLLSWERELMEEALAEGVPVLGMCLGAQLLALASGGEVERMEAPYIGWPELTLGPGAEHDPLVSTLPDGLPVLKWHNDAIVPADDAQILATTDSPGAAIFRAGEFAWGSQMHLETTPDIFFEEWIGDPLEQEALRRAGLSPEAFVEETRARLPVQIEASAALFRSFGELVAMRELSERP